MAHEANAIHWPTKWLHIVGLYYVTWTYSKFKAIRNKTMIPISSPNKGFIL